MTENQARKRTRNLIDDASNLMREKLEKALASGVIKLDDYDDDFECPRIILWALLKDAMFQFAPAYKVKQKEAIANKIYALI